MKKMNCAMPGNGRERCRAKPSSDQLANGGVTIRSLRPALIDVRFSAQRLCIEA